MASGLSFLLAFSLLATQAPPKAAVPETPRKEVWKWSLAERLAARHEFNMNQLTRPQSPEKDTGRLPTEVMLAGSRNPELLLPGELFRQLLSLAYNPSDEVSGIFRANIMAEARDLVPPADFWERLASISADYIATTNRANALGELLPATAVSERGRLLSKISTAQAPLCGQRYRSLLAARSAFGSGFFDQFLYQAVAPHVHITVTHATSLEKLAWAERGCK
jgi:hypothetical protein